MRLILCEAAATKYSMKQWSLLVNTNFCLAPVENANNNEEKDHINTLSKEPNN